jgi:hypothetical protein
MATPSMTSTAIPPTNGTNRGKDQIQWSPGVWNTLDQAVTQEMMRTRVAAKFLPPVHVEKKQTTVASDIVIPPVNPAVDPSLSIDEAATNRIQEYSVQFRMSVAQIETEEQNEVALAPRPAATQQSGLHTVEPGTAEHHQLMHSHQASTGVSLAMRTANLLAQAEDLILFNGQNAVANSPLFQQGSVQSLDPNLRANVGLGLLNINAGGDIALPAAQVVFVHPTVQAPAPRARRGAAAGPAPAPPRYAENALNAVAQGFSILQGLGHYEHYALVLHTVPYADLHQALPTTLIEPVEPVSHLVKAGIHGTGTLPPFSNPGRAGSPGLPTTIGGGAISTIDGAGNGNVLYTGVLVSLSGNTMDHVRGCMDDNLDVSVTFNQKDANEQYRFRVVQRFCLRLKDPTAVVLLLFMDT